MPLLRIRRHRPPGLVLCLRMTDGEREVLESLGLYHITFMSKIRSNSGLLTVLVERWHSETSSFHLPAREATMMLKDVWCILWIPTCGDLVVYNPTVGHIALHRMFRCGDAELGI